jgi:serine kinase of HPr protein (carbohydrate metabolism regulator)
MEEAVIKNALAYAARHQLELAERLGFGIHGMIFVAKHKAKGGRTAVKAHRELEPYLRERRAYERLKGVGVTEVLGFNVPQLIRKDEDLRVIEMSIVTRPFVLDFAGAYLDAPPEFPDEIWSEWETGKREQFEARWPEVEAVLAALEELDIYMVDVSPSNIAFLG